MNKRKILNDPIYGFLSFKYDILYDLIDHPYFQRLRRISQLGLSSYVYPGAVHTRFHHALGALHLMTLAIETLKYKGIEITEEEEIGVSIAILLHDIGHGPFSHALEHMVIPISHEEISLAFMSELNIEFDGQLSLAIQIFENKYSKKFLNQLISSQLDMDRMDYLNRDSFFTGVAEGVIGYERIIKMLNVRNNELVIEVKGIFSIEKFLIARRIMYWQVYLHKTVISAEQMLRLYFRLYRSENNNKTENPIDKLHQIKNFNNISLNSELLELYSRIDDISIWSILKNSYNVKNETLGYLAKSLLNRDLFKIIVQKEPFSRDQVNEYRLNTVLRDTPTIRKDDLMIEGVEKNLTYDINKNEIKLLLKDESIKLFSEISDFNFNKELASLYFLCFPKNI